MSIILITILILFLIKLLRDSLYFAWLWQVKEYRMDRMKSYLKEDRQIIKNSIFYLVALFLILTFYLSQQIFIYLTLLFFTFTFYQILTEIKSRTLKRPKFTFKIILIFFIEAAFCFSLFAFYWIPVFTGMTKLDIVNIGMTENLILLLLFFYLITPFLIAAIILLINPFFNFQKRRIIKKAAVKMKKLKKVKVIGITGSYGKTSTKEFLYAVLSQKYKVVKTEGNNNTNIGVAYTVLNKVSDDCDYFICEMGAYKIGEIAEICRIVNPEIGILTGINEQHIDLFGSIENTIKAKFELIEALPENGLAILNGDNKYIKLRIKNRSESFSPTVNFFRAETLATSIKVVPDYIEFVYKNQKFRVNLLGKHYIENILSAIITAEYLGMSLDEIVKAVARIKPTEYMMRKLDGPNNSVFINDSYSANPDGVIAALDYLDEAYTDYKKIIVFPGIIELGKESDDVHKKLFSKIENVCDVAYIVSQKSIKLKVYKVNENNCKFVFEKDFDKVAVMIRKKIKYGDADTKELQSGDWNQQRKTVVLFESRGAGVVMKKIL